MKRNELEELISAYLDNELPEPQKAKVETLVRSNSVAKEIYDGYMLVRSTLHRHARSVNFQAPPQLSDSILRRIGGSGAALSETLSQTFSGASSPSLEVPRKVDVLGPIAERLRNPRLIVYPTMVLAVALMLFSPLSPMQRSERNVAHNTPADVSENDPQSGPKTDPVISEGANKSASGIYAPMPGSEIIKGDHSEAILPKDLRIICRIDKKALKSSFFPGLFAEHGIEGWKQKSRPSSGPVYEAKISVEQLRLMLERITESGFEIEVEAVEKSLENLTAQSPDSELIKTQFQIETK